MGVNWAGGLIRWVPHESAEGRVFPLNHLHPFRLAHPLEASKGHPSRRVVLHVGFGLHCFTIKPRGVGTDLVSDNRETRTFDVERYELSRELPDVIRRVVAGKLRCERAGADNYVAVDLINGHRYGVFFNMKRWSRHGPDSMLLMVQSAYALHPGKQHPGRGRCSFNLLLGEVLRGKAVQANEPNPREFSPLLADIATVADSADSPALLLARIPESESPGQQCWSRLRKSDALGYTRSGRDPRSGWGAHLLGYVLHARRYGLPSAVSRQRSFPSLRQKKRPCFQGRFPVAS